MVTSKNPIIRIIAMVTVVAFVLTNCGLGYAIPNTSHLREVNVGQRQEDAQAIGNALGVQANAAASVLNDINKEIRVLELKIDQDLLRRLPKFGLHIEQQGHAPEGNFWYYIFDANSEDYEGISLNEFFERLQGAVIRMSNFLPVGVLPEIYMLKEIHRKFLIFASDRKSDSDTVSSSYPFNGKSNYRYLFTEGVSPISKVPLLDTSVVVSRIIVTKEEYETAFEWGKQQAAKQGLQDPNNLLAKACVNRLLYKRTLETVLSSAPAAGAQAESRLSAEDGSKDVCEDFRRFASDCEKQLLLMKRCINDASIGKLGKNEANVRIRECVTSIKHGLSKLADDLQNPQVKIFLEDKLQYRPIAIFVDRGIYDSALGLLEYALGELNRIRIINDQGDFFAAVEAFGKNVGAVGEARASGYNLIGAEERRQAVDVEKKRRIVAVRRTQRLKRKLRAGILGMGVLAGTFVAGQRLSNSAQPIAVAPVAQVISQSVPAVVVVPSKRPVIDLEKLLANYSFKDSRSPVRLRAFLEGVPLPAVPQALLQHLAHIKGYSLSYEQADKAVNNCRYWDVPVTHVIATILMETALEKKGEVDGLYFGAGQFVRSTAESLLEQLQEAGVPYKKFNENDFEQTAVLIAYSGYLNKWPKESVDWNSELSRMRVRAAYISAGLPSEPLSREQMLRIAVHNKDEKAARDMLGVGEMGLFLEKISLANSAGNEDCTFADLEAEGYSVKTNLKDYGYRQELYVYLFKDGQEVKGVYLTFYIYPQFKTIEIKDFYPSFPKPQAEKEKIGRGRALLRHIIKPDLYGGYDVIATAVPSFAKSFVKIREWNPLSLEENRDDFIPMRQNKERTVSSKSPLYEAWCNATVYGVMPIAGEARANGENVELDTIEDSNEYPGVVQSEFTVTSPGMPFDFVKTLGAHSCVIVTMYDPKTQIGILAHLDFQNAGDIISYIKMAMALEQKGVKDAKGLRIKLIHSGSDWAQFTIDEIKNKLSTADWFNRMDESQIAEFGVDDFQGNLVDIAFNVRTGEAYKLLKAFYSGSTVEVMRQRSVGHKTFQEITLAAAGGEASANAAALPSLEKGEYETLMREVRRDLKSRKEKSGEILHCLHHSAELIKRLKGRGIKAELRATSLSLPKELSHFWVVVKDEKGEIIWTLDAYPDYFKTYYEHFAEKFPEDVLIFSSQETYVYPFNKDGFWEELPSDDRTIEMLLDRSSAAASGAGQLEAQVEIDAVRQRAEARFQEIKYDPANNIRDNGPSPEAARKRLGLLLAYNSIVVAEGREWKSRYYQKSLRNPEIRRLILRDDMLSNIDTNIKSTIMTLLANWDGLNEGDRERFLIVLEEAYFEGMVLIDLLRTLNEGHLVVLEHILRRDLAKADALAVRKAIEEVLPYVEAHASGIVSSANAAAMAYDAIIEGERPSTHANDFISIMDRARFEGIIDPAYFLKGKVLDIGLETEFEILAQENLVTYLKRRGVDIVGLDPKVPAGAPAYLTTGIVQNMPFRDDQFDSVVSLALFSYDYFEGGVIKDGVSTLSEFYRRSAREIRRVLKNKGLFLASVTEGNQELIKAFTDEGFTVRMIDRTSYLFENNKSNGAVFAASAAGRGQQEIWGIYDTDEALREIAETVAEMAEARFVNVIYKQLPDGLSERQKFIDGIKSSGAKVIIRVSNNNLLAFSSLDDVQKRELTDENRGEWKQLVYSL